MVLFRLNIIDFLRSFFPLQLLITHFKYNLTGLLAWSVFFLIVTDNLGFSFGLSILFFSPEYLGSISALSFALLGFGFGGLMTAFNTYSYSKLARHFPFLVFVKRPFMWFSKNNSTIPLIFFALYLYKMILYQWTEEYASIWMLLWYCCSFFLGVFLFVLLSLFYFLPLSQRFRILYFRTEGENNQSFRAAFRPSQGRWYHRMFAQTDRRYLYLGRGLKLFLSRSVTHIDDKIIQKALNQIRLNTTVFEIMTLLTFVSLSTFSDHSLFEVPAAMSIVLLITLLFIIYSILETWFRLWTPLLFLFFLLGINFLSSRSSYFSYKNYAYGLDYSDDKRPDYSLEAIQTNAQENPQLTSTSSLNQYIDLLTNWKIQTGEERPKLILVNSSGGGLRSALWTFHVLQKLDQEFNGQLKRHVHLYVGASGGLVGAAYFRELSLRATKNEIKSIYSNEYYEKLGQDMLNKLAFSVSTRDVLIRLQHFDYQGKRYPKDRGYAFEQQLHANTDHLMDHTLGYYQEYEKTAQIPLMIFSPSIVNDGRRLLISSQSLRFLTTNPPNLTTQYTMNENIDYLSFCANVDPMNIRFSSVMRASATFPFVSPMVTLPTRPEVYLMDAGIRDNYGGKITVDILFALQDWIKKNTSGVILLQIRDTKKILDNMTYKQMSWLNKLTFPIANIYSNYPKNQDFDQEQLLKIVTHQLPYPIDVLQFNLREKANDQISLSWHMSTQEKRKIQQAFYSEQNQEMLTHLKKIMGQP